MAQLKSSPSAHSNKSLKILNVAASIYAICFAWPFIYDRSGLWFVVWMASTFIYLLQLGKLVSQSGRSVFLWVVCTLMTGPIGVLVSYASIKRLLADEIG